MEKFYGTTIRQDGLQRIGRDTWMLFWGLYETVDGNTYEYRHTFKHRPTIDEIKTVIETQINADTDAKILSGFVWRDMPVWLSQENQMNFKAAYDLAVQTEGRTLPVRFKLGEGKDGNAIYHAFEDLQEFSDFYMKSVEHITTNLNDGWAEKDSVDYSIFIIE